MVPVLGNLSQQSTRLNRPKRRLDDNERPVVKRVKSSASDNGNSKSSEHNLPDFEKLGTQEFYCPEYLEDVMETCELEETVGKIDDIYILGKKNKEAFLRRRKRLLSWLIPITCKFNCNPAVVYKMACLLDRYFAKREVPVAKMQLAGSVALLLASKYHDTYPVTFRSMVELSAGSFTYNDVVAMEVSFLHEIDFALTYPLILEFLHYFLLHFTKEEHQIALKRVSHYISECLLLETELIGAAPKTHAAVAMYWTLQIVTRTRFGEQMGEIFGMTEAQLLRYGPNILASTFPKFQQNGPQKVYFLKYPKLIEKIFRNRTLKQWVRRRCEQIERLSQRSSSGN